MNSHSISKKTARSVILAVTLGNFLEWYEIYLYVYWTPILSKLFFNYADPLTNMILLLTIFGLGFLARPLGGLFFGRLGDRVGRRKALILSVLSMILPTLLTGLLPTYHQVGIAAPILLLLLRILQSFPAGGELPGAFCYLYESASTHNRRFICSWAAVGYQTGILFSIIECFFLEKLLSPDDLDSWGWRISFIVGGCIGFIGLILRTKLHETPLFLEMETHLKVVSTPILQVLGKHKKNIFLGIFFCVLNSSSFYILSINFPNDFGDGYLANLFYSIAILLLITIPLPFFGWLGDRYDNKKILIGSTIGILILLGAFCLTSAHFLHSLEIILFCLLFTVLSALIPFIVPDLFPTRVRFTCVALSFNLADAVIGGFTPAAALYLRHAIGLHSAFCWILLFTALLSLGSYIAMKDQAVPQK